MSCGTSCATLCGTSATQQKKLPQRVIESHSNASSSSLENLNNEEGDESTVPTATPKTMSCMRLSKHKTHLKQYVIVSH